MACKGGGWIMGADYSAPPPLSYPAVTFPTLQNLTFSAQQKSRVVVTRRFLPTPEAELK